MPQEFRAFVRRYRLPILFLLMVFPGSHFLAACYILMDREKEAHAEAAEVLRINPKFSLDFFAKTLSYKDQSQNDKLVNALRKAGLK